MKSNYTVVSSQTRNKLAEKINDEINRLGPDNIISIVMDEGGKFAGATVFATIKAYIYYKSN